MTRTRALPMAMCLAASLLLTFGCNSSDQKKPAATAAATGAGTAKPYQAVQEPLSPPKRPGLLLAEAWFYKSESGAPTPGPARLEIWRRDKDDNWTRTRLEDPDSNVFHKAMPYDGGILTIGAEGAYLKKWTFTDGAWKQDVLWKGDWNGKYDRLRDVEIGDVDGDGKDEIVIATHDAGVVAVVDPAEGGGKPHVTEMDEKPDTFIHEIEIGDIDGDGKNEFFATPSDRNRFGASQAGGVVMYRYNPATKKYDRTWVEHQTGTHAKEILAHDMDGDGKAELFSSLEAMVDPTTKKVTQPVEIRQYHMQPDGIFDYDVIAKIDDRQNRFLVPVDFDGDGRDELIACALKTGIYYITPPAKDATDGQWKTTRIETDSSGFEHACFAADLDGDGKPEFYVASDDQGELRRYDHKGGTTFTKKVIGPIDPSTLTFNITSGTF